MIDYTQQKLCVKPKKNRKKGVISMEVLPINEIDEIYEEDFIYNPESLETMLEEDEITPAEQGFMQGYIEATRA